jgi:hypothetical protein
VSEDAIAAGTRLLTAAEAAPRLGYTGKRGVERLRAEAAARVIPGIRRGRRWMFHWPTVVSAITRFAGTTKDNALRVDHGSSAGSSARGKQGGAGSNFSGSTRARQGIGARTGRAADPLSGDAACLLRRP